MLYISIQSSHLGVVGLTTWFSKCELTACLIRSILNVFQPNRPRTYIKYYFFIWDNTWLYVYLKKKKRVYKKKKKKKKRNPFQALSLPLAENSPIKQTLNFHVCPFPSSIQPKFSHLAFPVLVIFRNNSSKMLVKRNYRCLSCRLFDQEIKKIK